MIVGEPASAPADENVEYWRNTDWRRKTEWIPMAVRETRDGAEMLERDALRIHPVLRGLAILDQPRAGTYLVKEPMESTLRSVWSSSSGR